MWGRSSFWMKPWSRIAGTKLAVGALMSQWPLARPGTSPSSFVRGRSVVGEFSTPNCSWKAFMCRVDVVAQLHEQFLPRRQHPRWATRTAIPMPRCSGAALPRSRRTAMRQVTRPPGRRHGRQSARPNRKPRRSGVWPSCGCLIEIWSVTFQLLSRVTGFQARPSVHQDEVRLCASGREPDRRPHPSAFQPRRVLAARTSSPTASVSIRYSVWSPRYSPA